MRKRPLSSSAVSTAVSGFALLASLLLTGVARAAHGDFRRLSLQGLLECDGGNAAARGAAERLRGGAALPQEPPEAVGKQEHREQLYEAYNMLHSLAQDFHKPFDSPAVLVVGHQTSGKSALIEALMGFQFNQVGGGTKTRRPIALRMQYNPDCDQPRCYLTLENGREEPRSLSEIQAYIEAENKRLERDPIRSFDAREIMIRMEYRFCPNMILIDTPGLIQAPRGKHLNAQQQALLQVARESEQLVLQKMRCEDYIILCVEDTTDWKHATTRNVVMQVDPSLERTVLVCTKLDTKIPQFSTGEDLQDFIEAPLMQKMYGSLLGGPFFTSVPSGRVGRGRESTYLSNEAFVAGVRRAERDDSMGVAAKLGPAAGAYCLPRVGVSRLRRFLERRVEDCYKRNVARIVPLLQRELTKAEARLLATEREMSALSLDQLKAGAEDYREHFVRALGSAIQGTIQAPPDQFGETLESEQLQAGSFIDAGRVDTDQWDRLMEVEVGNSAHRLFGGAQYHRVLREFAYAVRHMSSPEITEDEIANAAGMGDMHDGVNFMRAACVIAVEKARLGFDPLLESLRVRAVHVLKRVFAVVEHMLKRDGLAMSEGHQKPFSFIVRRIYENFIEASVDDCLVRCRDDLKALTRFVTWDLGERSSGALHRSLPDTTTVQICSLARDYLDLMQLMEEAACTRSNADRTGAVVAALVRHVMGSWREHFARSVAMKFNCFFLMPFVDTFPFYLRTELDKVYSGDLAGLFDIAEARAALARRREELIAECKACHQIQGKFDLINAQLNAAHALYDRDAADTADALASLDAGAGGGWSSLELEDDEDSADEGLGALFGEAAGGDVATAEGGRGASQRAGDSLFDDLSEEEKGGVIVNAMRYGDDSDWDLSEFESEAPELQTQSRRRQQRYPPYVAARGDSPQPAVSLGGGGAGRASQRPTAAAFNRQSSKRHRQQWRNNEL
ncbi:hypothetical protein JKP88DRAFT_201174 [Tribonema minus]|uniref:Dynamin-type G domain-containing protein n=1 Tax=Tribonema minus TaxID=303371 RepID=A0A835YPI8_9STRA|nr:hypothetical protein JKP88DRAFT_201174 [Tribonema minus]